MNRTAQPDGQTIVDAPRRVQVDRAVPGDENGNLAVELAKLRGQSAHYVGKSAVLAKGAASEATIRTLIMRGKY